jgi:glutathione S-transferase
VLDFTLFGDSRSGNCYKPALLLKLTGRAFTWVETDVMAGATRRRDFLEMNPNGRVPLLRLPDGRFLAESNAMLLHLAEGTRYLPEDAYQRALVYQWLFFEQYSHEPFIAVARFICHFQRREAQEKERLEQLRSKGYEALGVMDRHLSGNAFMAGEHFSIADIALYAYTHVAAEGGFDLAPFAGVNGWLKAVESQSGFLPMDALEFNACA